MKVPSNCHMIQFHHIMPHTERIGQGFLLLLYYLSLEFLRKCLVEMTLKKFGIAHANFGRHCLCSNAHTGIPSGSKGLYMHTLCMEAAMVLASLQTCTGSPESSMLNNVIRNKSMVSTLKEHKLSL